MNKSLVTAGAIAFTAIASIIACSDETTATPAVDYTGSCADLSTRCHDVSSALGKECHDLGHDGDDAKCGPRKTECLAECPEVAHTEDGGGGGHDTGTSTQDSSTSNDGSTEPSAECTAYCGCMQAACSDDPNYPFTDPAVCLSACAAFSEFDRDCFQDFCEQAGNADGGSSKAHQCEHATGKLGSSECS